MMHPILPDTDDVITCDMLEGWDTKNCDRFQHNYGIYDGCFGKCYPLSVLHPLVGDRQYHVKLCTPALWYAQGWSINESS